MSLPALLNPLTHIMLNLLCYSFNNITGKGKRILMVNYLESSIPSKANSHLQKWRLQLDKICRSYFSYLMYNYLNEINYLPSWGLLLHWIPPGLEKHYRNVYHTKKPDYSRFLTSFVFYRWAQGIAKAGLQWLGFMTINTHNLLFDFSAL